MSGRYGKSNHAKSQRDARRQVEESQRVPYTPPPESECDTRGPIVTHLENGLAVFQESRFVGGKLVDFSARVVEYVDSDDPSTVHRALLSADCKNHGCIHIHDETNGHSKPLEKPRWPLYTRSDVEKYAKEAITALVTIADSLKRTEEGACHGSEAE